MTGLLCGGALRFRMRIEKLSNVIEKVWVRNIVRFSAKNEK